MKRLLLFVALLGFASSASAQTSTLIFEYPQTLPSVVATYTQSVAIDNVAVAGVPTCAAKPGSPTETQCSIAIPPITVAGSHNITITNAKGGNQLVTTFSGFDPTQKPTAPVNGRIVITIIIQVP